MEIEAQEVLHLLLEVLGVVLVVLEILGCRHRLHCLPGLSWDQLLRQQLRGVVSLRSNRCIPKLVVDFFVVHLEFAVISGHFVDEVLFYQVFHFGFLLIFGLFQRRKRHGGLNGICFSNLHKVRPRGLGAHGSDQRRSFNIWNVISLQELCFCLLKLSFLDSLHGDFISQSLCFCNIDIILCIFLLHVCNCLKFLLDSLSFLHLSQKIMSELVGHYHIHVIRW